MNVCSIPVVMTERETSYMVHVGPGAICSLPQEVSAATPEKQAIVVCDRAVSSTHGRTAMAALAEAGLRPTCITLPTRPKQMRVVTHMAETLVKWGAGRQTPIIAVGGGATGDTAGLVAALFMRGMPLFQVPTTLLGQVDSAIGGKNAVHFAGIANLLGTFHQPCAVIADTRFLQSLPKKELASGMAELLKTYLVADSDGLDSLVADLRATGGVLQSETKLASHITRACRIKARIAGGDQRDYGSRRVLNYGHTVGQAIEAAFGFRYTHGEAVALGMVAATCIGLECGVTKRETAEVQLEAIAAAGLPLKIERAKCLAGRSRRHDLVAQLTRYMRHDKKRGAGCTMVLLEDVGQPLVLTVREQDVRAGLMRFALDGSLSWGAPGADVAS